MRRSLRAVWLVVSTAIRVSPRQSLVSLGETVGIVFRLLQPLFLSWLVAGVVERDLRRIAVSAAAFVGSDAVRMILNYAGISARIGQLERVGYAFGCQVAATTARIPTLDHLESPAYLDQIQTIRDQEWSLGLATNMVLNSLANVVMVAGTVALASTADWRLLLVAVAGAPAVVAARWFVRWQAAAEDNAAQPGRLANHLLELGLDAGPGAELRVFGLAASMRMRLRTAADGWRRPFVGLAARKAAVDVAANVIFFGVAIVVLGWMTYDLIGGRLSLQALVLALLLVGRLQSIGSLLQGTIGSLSQVVRTTSRILWLFDYERDVDRVHAGAAQPPTVLRHGIRLENLTYHYPDIAAPALDNVSVALPAGSVVALVGENGAGKSTLVKLLAGLYRPSGGRILVDDVALDTLDIAGWRARMSGAFQDYARFEVTAGDCVGLGDLEHLHDQAHIRTALRAGAADGVIEDLPDGLATRLGAIWPGGVDISGGQWQRLALARGMMRTHPLLLVLDEPTAALDAHTEHDLFERYAAAARAGQHAGTVTLLVTHRFSTVAAADHILVLDRGRLIEQGTHDQLIAARGHYSELYELQATGYR